MSGYALDSCRGEYLLPEELALSLLREGQLRGQQPAGTYARQVFQQLLIDLSWSSSRLEGNRFSLLSTEELFRRGSEGGDGDAIMLLNHKKAIEFLVDAVPEYVAMDVYAYAMIGIYERNDVSLAIDLFAWTYRRSIRKYAAIVQSRGAPDPFRLKYRDQLSMAVQKIVQHRLKSVDVVRDLHLPAAAAQPFHALLQEELRCLSIHNCARHRLAMDIVDDWVSQGRPF